jgi:general L-amino acid transport system permease protein
MFCCVVASGSDGVIGSNDGQAGRRRQVNLSLNDPTVRAFVFQALIIGAVVALAVWLVGNTMDNLQRRSIATGFHFLEREAAFGIGESLIEYHPSNSYGYAFIVGVLNTLKVAGVGVAMATILGLIVGISRLSSNWLVSRLATVYVEVLRNIPPLLQLFVWYGVISESMPMVKQALNPMPGFFISKKGVWLAVPMASPVWAWMGVAALAGIAIAWGVSRWAAARQARTGAPFPTMTAAFGLILGLPLLVWLLGGAPVAMDMPKLKGFGFVGGINLSPEFFAILCGLAFYTSAFIAEIVRGGIVAVSWGQTEAARSLGLSQGHTLRLVVLPQALRVMVPPLTSQYLNLTKNSSLALAIGYPDLVAIANTIMNQTGQAIEGVAMIMGTYLTISLLISAFMNWYNRRIALVER